MRVLLFGDQTGDFRPVLRRVSQEKENALLQAFLERSYASLRLEVAYEPRPEREQITGFTSISDLAARYAESDKPKSNAVESALTCISQLACFFRYMTTV